MKDQELNKLVEKIRSGFKNAKHLLKPHWKTKNIESGIDSTGFCYIASEVLFHMLGGLSSGYKPRYYKINEQETHWWLYNDKTGDIIDPTFDQFPFKIDYSKGKKACFLTGYNKISKKALKFMEML